MGPIRNRFSLGQCQWMKCDWLHYISSFIKGVPSGSHNPICQMEVLGLTTFLLSWESTSLLFLKSQIKKLKTVISDSDSLICGVGQNGGI
ncbi:hypothetical protein I79_000888 [Cricetulus griseus]|uniref:Uncharacterized protein n=1 Tax=Cricetulus griseus TaxID=10029 RepID=G3GTB1_CRIGR|nr:hypothetical protein I79_000888 [Cricetulus griseus]